MSKEYVTLTIEFESDAPWDDVVHNLISRIGNLDNDELGYTITKVYNNLFGTEYICDENEDWYNDD